MKTARFLLLGGCLLMTQAYATSFVVSTDITLSLTLSSSKGTSGSFKDDKIVLAARDDAAAFVGSDGDIRGAQMEAALQRIRSLFPELSATDLQLAEAILML